MRISIFTTITNPEKYRYAWKEALANYCDFADEVIVIDGHHWYDEKTKKEVGLDHHALFVAKYPQYNEKTRWRYMNWPEEWDWSELPKHLNLGLESCTGDWAIKMDIDYLIHESEFDKIKKKLFEYLVCEIPVAYFVKFNILNRFEGYEKAVLPLAINTKKAKELNIKYGIALDEKTDWCYPILVSGEDEKRKIPQGKKLPDGMTMPLSANIYNYDYFFRTKEVAKSEFHRFSKAYATAFNWSWGINPEESFEIFVRQMKGRYNKKPQLKEVFHPKHIIGRINKMMPDEFGYNNWNNFENL